MGGSSCDSSAPKLNSFYAFNWSGESGWRDWGLLTAGFICLFSSPTHRRPTGNFPGSCCWVSPPGASVAGAQHFLWHGLTLNTSQHLAVLTIQILSQGAGITTLLIQSAQKPGEEEILFKNKVMFSQPASQSQNNSKWLWWTGLVTERPLVMLGMIQPFLTEERRAEDGANKELKQRHKSYFR